MLRRVWSLVPWFDLRAPSCLPSYAFWFFLSGRLRSDAPSRFWRASRRIAMGRVFYEPRSETRGRSRRRSSGQAFRVEAVLRQPGLDTSTPIGEAIRSWPEPELVLRSERWAEGGQDLKRVLRAVELRLSGQSRGKKAILLGRGLAWKSVPEGPRVYEPDRSPRAPGRFGQNRLGGFCLDDGCT